MEIKRGKIRKGIKIVVYGPEGIGKSTFVSKIPGVVFIDTEGSTGEMDVPRFPRPTSWTMLLNEVQYAIDHPSEVPALIIDTGDWAERLCLEHVLATHTVQGKAMQSIEDAGYGKGYTYLYEEFGKLMNLLSDLSEKGVHCGFTAHAMMRKFEQPDEQGQYDRWELKMSKKVSPLVKEWSSLMLFANYKTFVYTTDKDGKKHKASGGSRVMYASHHPCWDAKNRYGLPDEMPFDFKQIESLFDVKQNVEMSTEVKTKAIEARPEEKKESDEKIQQFTPVESKAEVDVLAKVPEVEPQREIGIDYSKVPQKLAELMVLDNITPFEVQAAIAARGYFPIDTSFENYPDDFVKGVLIGAWPKVRELVLSQREGVPF